MKTQGHLRLIVMVVLLLGHLGGLLFAQREPRARRIPFQLNKPITERLLADDEVVVIAESPIPPGRVSQGVLIPLKDEFDRMALHEAIIVVEATESAAVLVESESWIRTRVSALIEQLVQADEKPLGRAPGFVTFEYDGGEALFGSVVVKAGIYPQFLAGYRYLVFLGYDQSPKSWILSAGYTIDANGKLGRLKRSDGSFSTFETALYGLPLDRVIRELEQRRR